MPHSIPVSKLMINRNEWPQLSADIDVSTAIKILRIISEEKKLEHGHSTPLILDENYNLLGFVRLTDLLKSLRHLWKKTDQPCELDQAAIHLKDLAIPFKGSVQEDDSILKALDIMLDNDVSLVPVIEDGKLQGIVKLSDIFNTVAALLVDEQDSDE
jgi:CBS domain containing-hemolysin-like protein